MPGQVGGGSFQKEKNYIAKKEFAYRMCARRPTSAMPKSFLCCERAFCRSMVVMSCTLKWSVLMSWCLLRGQVMWWSRHLMRCDGLCCVMSRDAMRCHGDELYYSSTTLYYKVLLQYYSCTTKYYSNTTLYYKVLLQYYYYTPVLVLQSTTPVLLCTTKYYSVLQSTTPVLPCTTKYYSSTNLYYKVLLQYYKVLLQYYKVLLQVLQNSSHDWSASHMKGHLQCAEQQKAASNFSKYCACDAKWISWLIRIAYETSFTMRRATGITLQLHQILRLPRKMNLMIDPHHIWNVIYNAQSNRHHPPTSPNTAPATQNESHDWSTSHMKRHLQCAEQQSTPSNFTKYCACHAKWISWLIHITYETSFTMRGATVNTLQPHQILRLPRKMNLMIDPHHIWNVIYNARSNSQHPPTSPNTAPATQNDHPTSDRNLLKTAETSFPMRDRSEHDPSMIRPWKRKPQPAAPQRLLFTLARSRFYWKLQRFPLRLSFQISPNAAPATKSDTWTSPNAAPATKSDTWTSPNAAPATKSDTWTSPNAAPATKSDTKWHMTTTCYYYCYYYYYYYYCYLPTAATYCYCYC